MYSEKKLKTLKMSGKEKVFQLKCSWQSNNWGKLGEESEVARLLKSSDPNFEIDANARYAELWMGTHVKWPSQIQESSQSLVTWLQENPESFGHNIISQFGRQLPFVLKVLSIDIGLSLQAHPDKELAARLHVKDPTNYLDSNHKPELCIALTPFRGLCGFRPIEEIIRFLNHINELANVVGQNNIEGLIRASEAPDTSQQELALKHCFAALLRQDDAVIRKELRKLVNRVKHLDQDGGDFSELEGGVLLYLFRDYPDDVGCFSVYFLNVINLQPGEAIYLETGVLHTYLEGNCVECLACSDNILRAGLTAKHRDIETLIDMLKYKSKLPEDYKLTADSVDDNGVLTFRPSVTDFAVSQIWIRGPARTTLLHAIRSASILICTEGTGTVSNNSIDNSIYIKPGIVIFISANEECELNSDNDMLLYRAFVANDGHVEHLDDVKGNTVFLQKERDKTNQHEK